MEKSEQIPSIYSLVMVDALILIILLLFHLIHCYYSYPALHGLINYIDTRTQCRHLKKCTCKGTLRQVFICMRPPLLYHPPPYTLYIYSHGDGGREGES
jgi:hypothetical protein